MKRTLFSLVCALSLAAGGVADARTVVHVHTHSGGTTTVHTSNGYHPGGSVTVVHPGRPVYYPSGGYYSHYYYGGPYYYHPYYYRPGYYSSYATTGYSPWTWYAGAGAFGTKILSQSGPTEQLDSGGGVSLWGGIRFNRRFGLELGWLGSFHNPSTTATWYGNDTNYLVLEGVTADAKIHLNGSGNFDPYIQGGLGVYFLGREGLGASNVGTGFQAGLGLDYWIGDVITLGLRARLHGISMGPPQGQSGDSVFLTAATVEASVALHF
jgi:hypothetical protein